jgi:hypothetical protein
VSRVVTHIFGVLGACAVIAAAPIGSGAILESQGSGTGPLNSGSTQTNTRPPAAPKVSMAVPAIKGPAPLPPEEQGLPG